MTYRWTIKWVICISTVPVLGQNLELIGETEPVKVTGGISFNQIGYLAQGMDARRNPYSFVLTGTTNFSIYEWQIPFSFSYSNQQQAFGQPFNQYSLHPTYKGFTAHMGYASMNFSKYTVGGHLFLGVGVEQKFKNLSVHLLHGRFRKAIDPTDSLSNQSASYERWGSGFKTSYEGNRASVSVIMFKGQDRPQDALFVDSLALKPEANLVWSIETAIRPHANIQFDISQAWSALTRDIRLPETVSPKGFLNPGLVPFNETTEVFRAVKYGVNYQRKGGSLGAAYERVDPGYRTHGAYFFASDFENITLNGSKVLFSSKLQLTSNLGIQRDNLAQQKVSQMNRWVGALSIGWNSSEKWSINGNYSTFQTFTNIQARLNQINQQALTPFDRVDTLDFTQIAKSAGLNLMYVVKSNEQTHQQLTANFNWQESQVNQNDMSAGNRFMLGSAGYTVNLRKQALSISAFLNVNQNVGNAVTSNIAPTISITKSYLDNQLRWSNALTVNESRSTDMSTGRTINFRTTGQLRSSENQLFQLSGVGVWRNAKRNEERMQTEEWTITLSYNYHFSR